MKALYAVSSISKRNNMHNVKVLGLVGFVTTLGITALVGCGGSDASPSLAITNANMKTVAGESLVDGAGATNFNLFGSVGGTAFAPTAVHGLRNALARVTHPVGVSPIANATTTTPCDGGGTMTEDGATPAPGAVSGTETITYAACIQDGTTTDGSVKISSSLSGTSITISASVNLTIKSAASTLTETGGVTISLDSANLLSGSSHIT